MTRARWALVALGVGLVAWGLDALVRTKAQGYGRPVFHTEAHPPPSRPVEVSVVPEDGAGPFHLGGHVHAPWEQAEGLGVCQQCGNLPDTPGHELGCPIGRAQYGPWTEDAYRRLMAHYGAQVQPPTAQLRPEDFTT